MSSQYCEHSEKLYQNGEVLIKQEDEIAIIDIEPDIKEENLYDEESLEDKVTEFPSNPYDYSNTNDYQSQQDMPDDYIKRLGAKNECGVCQKDSPKRKRRRLNPVHRWMSNEADDLVNRVAEAVKDKPESFEKPTSQRFYEILKSNSIHLKNIDWLIMKSKMRNLKFSYISANQWKTQTGAKLLANGDEKTVNEYIQRMCPYFDLLDTIFHQSNSINPPVVNKNTNIDALLSENDDCPKSKDLEDDDVDSIFACSQPTPSPLAIANSRPTTSASNSIRILDDDSQQTSSVDFSGTEKKFENMIKTSKANSSSVNLFITMQQQKLDFEKKKFEWQLEKEKKELHLKELEITQNFELKKLELEMQEKIELKKQESEERLKRYEIDLKYKINNS